MTTTIVAVGVDVLTPLRRMIALRPPVARARVRIRRRTTLASWRLASHRRAATIENRIVHCSSVPLRYADHLPGLLGIGIIASDEKIRTNPGEVRRFVRAINRGLKYAIDNPQETARILKKHQPLVNEDVAARELKVMKFFVETQGVRRHGMGYIDIQKVKSTTSVVANGFRIGGKISYRDIYAPGFVKTATFVPPKK